MKMRRWNKMLVAVLAAFGLSMAMVGYTDPLQEAGTNAASPTSVVASAPVDLPPVPAEVLRMSGAGMSDDVITSYIQKSANSCTLDAEQIIYLHDVGVSSSVLDVLVKHGGMAASGPAAEASSGPADTGNVSPAAAPPVSDAAAGFYDSLAPYGTWVNVPGYGWCWQPTVGLVDPAWQPYCNNGSWLWTDQGWYWNSYYSWGWAPFHYGRWCQSPGHGWVWCPDNTWGPAWVCWRDYPGYCGWAPLPPGACFTSGIGWTFNGIAVGFNFGFGLGSCCFTFCDFDDFCGRHSFEHFRHGHDADRFFHGSRVDNNFAVDAHHRFFNRGIDPSRIEAATHKRIGQVSVRELPHGVGHSGDFGRPDRLIRSGHDQVIFRPGHDLSAARNHFLPEHHAQLAYHGGGDTASHGFTAGPEVGGNTPRFQPGRPNGFQHTAPNISMNPSSGNVPDRQWGGAGNSQMRSTMPPASGYQHNVSNSRNFTPTPAWHPAPAWQSTPAWHPAPSQSWNGGSQNGGGTRSWNGGSQNWSGGSQNRGGGSQWGGGMSSGHGFHR